MVRSVILGIALAGLSACTTTKLQPGQSTSLTSDQIEDVKQSLVWDLEQSTFASADDLKGIKFIRFAASRSPAPSSKSEIVTVCGTFQLRTRDGGYTNDMAFLGILSDYPSRLHNDRLLTSFVGKTPEGAAQLLGICRARAIKI